MNRDELIKYLKLLEWSAVPADSSDSGIYRAIEASSAIGEWSISWSPFREGLYRLFLDGCLLAQTETLDAAKQEAAEAYQQTILECFDVDGDN